MKRILMFTMGAATLFAQSQSTVVGSRTVKGNWDASGANTTKPARTGSALPSTCSVGEVFFRTGQPAGQNLYVCASSDTWTLLAGGGSGPLPDAGGDLSGSLTSALVTGVQGRPVSSTAPTNGQVLTWGGTQWTPETPSGGTGGSVSSTVAVFDGSTIVPSETMTAWTCGSGSAASCTTSWTVPSGVRWVRVTAWSGGGGGGGSTSGDRGGAGGGGGGFVDATCAVTPGVSYTVTVGLGGMGSSTGYAVAGAGGNSGFGSCFALLGGQGGNGTNALNFGGYLSGSALVGWQRGDNALNSGSSCTPTLSAGSSAIRLDGGGCGGGTIYTNATAGAPGGTGIGGAGGGGSGGNNNATYGAGGASGLGGTGGGGGAWTVGGGLVACSAGALPGGGGGGAGTTTGGNGNLTGCAGARGEVRIHYIQ